MTKEVVISGVLMLLFSDMRAQPFSSDSDFISVAASVASEIYSERMKDHIHLYDGSDYRIYSKNGDQHPYYNEDWEVGSVFYNGSLYSNEEMLYDLYRDQVIIQDFYGGNFIQLVAEKIDHFNLNDHTFVRISDKEIPSGFYDLRVDGEIKFYIKRSKAFKEVVTSDAVVDEFKTINKYYIYRNNTYYQVKNKRTVRLILRDYEDSINPFIKKEHLDFRSNFEYSMIRLIQFCNGL